MNKIKYLLFALAFPIASFAQYTETFDDGEFLKNPTWEGQTSNFIVNTGGQLQLKAPSVADASYLSTAAPAPLKIDSIEWQADAKIPLNSSTTTTTVYADIWIMADNKNLKIANGYFLRIGAAAQNIDLFEKTGSSSKNLTSNPIKNTFIIDPVEARVKVIKIGAKFSIYIDLDKSNNFILRASGTGTHSIKDSVNFYTGVSCTYTSSKSEHFMFDNFYIGKITSDTRKPKAISATGIDIKKLDILFDENIDKVSAENIANYSISGFNVTDAKLDVTNLALVHLTVDNDILPLNSTKTVSVSNVMDIANNSITPISLTFSNKPTFIKTTKLSGLILTATFTNAIQSGGALSDYTVLFEGNTINPTSATPNNSTMTFTFSSTDVPNGFEKNKVYTINVTGITDKRGYAVETSRVFGLVQKTTKKDIIINEFLVNPTQYQFVEIYNNSNKILDLNSLYIAVPDPSALTFKGFQVSTPDLFLPGDYVVLTKNGSNLSLFTTKYGVVTDNFIKVQKNGSSDLPTLTKTKDNILLYDSTDTNIIDRVDYTSAFHTDISALDSKGDNYKSLERKDFNAASSVSSNWATADPKVLATPGYKNSNYISIIINKVVGEIIAKPKVFAPYEIDANLSTINFGYKFEKPNLVANVFIFNSQGQMVTQIVKQEILLNTEGTFQWDGKLESKDIVPTGIYTVLFEVFDEFGNVTKIKEGFAVGAKIN